MVTWSELFLFGALIIDLIALVIAICRNNNDSKKK